MTRSEPGVAILQSPIKPSENGHLELVALMIEGAPAPSPSPTPTPTPTPTATPAPTPTPNPELIVETLISEDWENGELDLEPGVTDGAAWFIEGDPKRGDKRFGSREYVGLGRPGADPALDPFEFGGNYRWLYRFGGDSGPEVGWKRLDESVVWGRFQPSAPGTGGGGEIVVFAPLEKSLGILFDEAIALRWDVHYLNGPTGGPQGREIRVVLSRSNVGNHIGGEFTNRASANYDFALFGQGIRGFARMELLGPGGATTDKSDQTIRAELTLRHDLAAFRTDFGFRAIGDKGFAMERHGSLGAFDWGFDTIQFSMTEGAVGYVDNIELEVARLRPAPPPPRYKGKGDRAVILFNDPFNAERRVGAGPTTAVFGIDGIVASIADGAIDSFPGATSRDYVRERPSISLDGSIWGAYNAALVSSSLPVDPSGTPPFPRVLGLGRARSGSSLPGLFFQIYSRYTLPYLVGREDQTWSHIGGGAGINAETGSYFYTIFNRARRHPNGPPVEVELIPESLDLSGPAAAIRLAVNVTHQDSSSELDDDWRFRFLIQTGGAPGDKQSGRWFRTTRDMTAANQNVADISGAGSIRDVLSIMQTFLVAGMDWERVGAEAEADMNELDIGGERPLGASRPGAPDLSKVTGVGILGSRLLNVLQGTPKVVGVILEADLNSPPPRPIAPTPEPTPPPPVDALTLFSARDTVTFFESETVEIEFFAVDPQGDPISFSTVDPPGFASLTDDGDGSGSIRFSPGYFDSGSYEFILRVDSSGPSPERVERAMRVNVGNSGRHPVVDSVGDFTIYAGQSIDVPLTAIDPDLRDTLFFSLSEAPGFVSIVDRGDRTATLELDTTAQDAGRYVIGLTVTDDDVPPLSTTRELAFEVLAAPSFARQPASQVVPAGARVVVGVEVAGAEPISLRWFKDGAPIPGAVGPTLERTSAAAPDSGMYWCEASNPGATVISDIVFLRVLSARRPNSAELVGHTIPSEILPNQRLPFTVTVRNTSGITWSAAQGYALATFSAPGGIEFASGERISMAHPLDVVPNNGGQIAFVGESIAPPTPGEYAIQFRMVEENVEFFPPIDAPALLELTVSVGDAFRLDFTGEGATTHGWIGGAVPGFGGSTFHDAERGLCMTVPGPGDNFTFWIGPANQIPLLDSTVYRARVALTTDQTDIDAIPLFSMTYSNFQPGRGFVNYGGERWLWDSNGGANGIGRPGGVTTFEFWFAPLAIALPQWTENDAGSGAFDPEADPFNDISFSARALDLDGSSFGAPDPLLAWWDSGTICIGSIELLAVPLAELRDAATTIYAPPLNDGSNAPGEEGPTSPSRTHFAQSNGSAATYPTVQADIRDGEWRVQFPPIDAASDPFETGLLRATLGPDVVAAGPSDLDPGPGFTPNPLRFMPIEWERDALYMIRAAIRSDADGGFDPVDAIILNHETFTAELGGLDFVTGGGDLNGDAPGDGGGMNRAGSPRSLSTTLGVAPEYIAFFHGNRATASVIANAARWKAQVDLFNRTDLGGGPNSGRDPIVVERLEVDRVDR